MMVYIVIGKRESQFTIFNVCDTKFLALKRKAHFEVSHPELEIYIEK